jgi:hypothetical protein
MENIKKGELSQAFWVGILFFADVIVACLFIIAFKWHNVVWLSSSIIAILTCAHSIYRMLKDLDYWRIKFQDSSSGDEVEK